jgi:hypothetical protein
MCEPGFLAEKMPISDLFRGRVVCQPAFQRGRADPRMGAGRQGRVIQARSKIQCVVIPDDFSRVLAGLQGASQQFVETE